MNKTFLRTLLAMVLVCAMVLPMFACTSGDTPADTTPDTSVSTTEGTTADTQPSTDTTQAETTVDTESQTEEQTQPAPVVVDPKIKYDYTYLQKLTQEGTDGKHWKQQTADAKEGYITLTSTGADPWISPLVDGVDMNNQELPTARTLAIKYRTDYSVTAQVFVNVRNTSKDKNFYWTGDGEWHLLVVNIADILPAKASTTLLRLDFANAKDVTIDIQYVALFENEQEALTYDATIENPQIQYDLSQMPDFKVSGVFGSHMVLQRDMPIEVWGFSNQAGSTVSGTFAGETATTQVGADGTWTLTFAAQAYNKVGQSMTISDDRGHATTLEDILIGDVWFVGGQSNAELTVAPCINYTPNMNIQESDAIRLFTQTQAYVGANQNYCIKPQADVINPAWQWKTSTTQAVKAFSAIGYFFAKEVYEETDIPQGMIMIAAGGACLSELLPAELAHAQGYTHGGNVREGGYYNALISPFVGMNCKGMLFFQGESEGGSSATAKKYKEEMTLLIQDERERWGQNFPVYYVQLSNYGDSGKQHFPYHDVVRIQQFDALQTIENSTMVVAMDLGSPAGYSDWAHSPLKYQLGLRLAHAALVKEYNKGDISQISSPMPLKATLSADGKQITIEFENVADGLVVLGKTPAESIGQTVAGFTVGTKKTTATATITSKNTVVVDVPEGVNPTSVNYAYFLIVTTENATLYASNDLPAPAFSIALD